MSFEIKDSGQRREFTTGAVRDRGEKKGRYDLLPVLAIQRVAKHYEAGALKYADRNWEKGMPAAVMLDSVKRHIDQYIAGDTSEDHLSAGVFGLLGIIEQEERKARGMKQYAGLFEGMGPLFEFQRQDAPRAPLLSRDGVAPGTIPVWREDDSIGNR